MRDTFDQFQPRDRGRFGDNESRETEVERLPAKGGKKLHDLECTVVRRSERAAQLRIAHNGREEWFPLSQIELTPLGGGKYTAAVPEWILKEKGLV